MRSQLSILTRAMSEPLGLFIAAALAMLGYICVYGIFGTQYESSAKIAMIEQRQAQADEHLQHLSQAQKVDLREIAERITQVAHARRLPWWFEYRSELKLQSPKESEELAAIDAFLSTVRVEIHPETQELSITLHGSEPTEIAARANALARSTVIDGQRLLEEKHNDYLLFLEQKVSAAETAIDQALERIERLQQARTAQQQEQDAARRVKALEHALAELVKERVQLETGLRRNAVSSEQLSTQNYQTALQEQLLETDLELSSAARELGPKHPKMSALRAERRRLEQLLHVAKDTARNDNSELIASIRTQEDVLRTQIQQAKSEQQQFFRNSNELNDAQSELASLQESKRWWTTQLAYAKTKRGGFSSPVRISVPASVPSQPQHPLSLSVLVLSGVSGALLLLAWRIRRLIRGKQFVSIAHAEAFLDAESVAVLPFVEGLFTSQSAEYATGVLELPHQKTQLLEARRANDVADAASTEDANAQNPAQVIHLLPQMIIKTADIELRVPNELQHAFRHLQNRIIFQLPSDARSIAITSAIPFEGKSTVASQLALAMAQAGYRSVIVDASVVFPSRSERAAGLAEVLAEETVLEDVLIAATAPGLWTLPAGNCRAQTRSLLYSKRFQETIRLLRSQFDFVVIDCPAISLAAESLYIADCADAYLLISDFELGDRHASRVALQQLLKTSSINAGLVLNRYDTRRGVPEQISVLA